MSQSESSLTSMNYHLTLIRTIKKLKKENQFLSMQLEKFKNQYIKSQNEIQILKEKLSEFKESQLNWFIENCVKNQGVKKNHRKFSEKMLTFCECLYITSPKAYKLLKNVVNIPSKSTLNSKYSNEIQFIKDSLIKKDISERLSLIPNSYLSVNLPISVSIDATVACSRPIDSDKNINNIFLIQIQPLCSDFKNIPFSLIQSKGGQINKDIHQQIDYTILQLSKYFKIIFKCTDGDPGTDQWHSMKFKNLYNYLTLDLSQIITMVHLDQWPISDFLHILKNQRCRLFHDLSLTIDSERISLNSFYRMIPSKSYSDKTNLSKFNDKLALIAFSIKNLQILLNNSKLSHFYFLLPFSLWESVLLSRNLDIDTRKQILEVVKFIFVKEYKNLEKNIVNDFPEKYSKSRERITFFSKSKLRRCIVTIIGVYYSLEYFPNKLALNRISSHPIENTFGITRSIMQNKIGVEPFISSMSRNIFRTKKLQELDIELPQFRKVSDAGVSLTNKENSHICITLNTIRNEICELRTSIQNQQNFNFQETELKYLVDSLAEDKSLIFKEGQPGTISGSSIAARNIATTYF